MGFVVEPDEAQEWIAADVRNAEVLFPYLNGEDLNSRPDSSSSRWVIDFNDWDEARAARYRLPYKRAAELVRPERQRKKPDGSYVLRNPLPERWWQYAEKRPAMRNAIADLGEVLVLAQVSNTAQPVFIPNGTVPSHKLVVFASDSRALLTCLASSVHYVWARKYSGAMKNDLSYSPSDVFLTLPQPTTTRRMEQIGAVLDEERREIMLRRNLGLTKIYNLVHDSRIVDDKDVERLRAIHVEIDDATVEAYGWDDIQLDHGFHSYRQNERWTVGAAARIEIVDRLLEENLRRAGTADQARIGSPSGMTQEGGDRLFN
ncbi:type IIL restriction-modification enzyme MmeI [Microbacterium lacticum]